MTDSFRAFRDDGYLAVPVDFDARNITAGLAHGLDEPPGVALAKCASSARHRHCPCVPCGAEPSGIQFDGM